MTDDLTLASLRRELSLNHQNITNELNEIKDEVKRINSTVQSNQIWIARLQGALALLTVLGVGNVIAFFAS
jgi:peptidoglycan hydrolase CwlO-like protein